jgi:aldose 1-epimerase
MTIESVESSGVTFLKVTNSVGLALTLSDFGAGIYEIRYLGVPMTIAQKDKAEWLHSDAYFGKTVGRIAGRIKEGKLDYLGKTYSLSVNEGVNTLHGGVEGFSFKMFKMDVVHLGDGIAVDYYLVSKALEMGFPGEVDLRVRYLIKENEPVFRIVYDAKSSEQTPLNFTSHTYFNLGGEDTVERQILYIDANETETYDSAMIPLGFAPAPKCLDFTTPKAVGKDINDPYLQNARTLGYDHCFAFRSNKSSFPVLTLENGPFKLSLRTSLPAVQIYSDNYPRMGALLTNGQKEKQHSGLAIEPVYKPNDFHAMTCMPYEGKRNFIEYTFSKKGE